MSIVFKVIPMINPNLKGDQKPKYYPRICNTKKINLEKMCKDISKNSSLNELTIKHVLLALEFQIADYLKEGYSVNLPGIGIIYPSISGEPSDSPENVTPDKIKKANINFRPAKGLKEAIRKVDFKKVK